MTPQSFTETRKPASGPAVRMYTGLEGNKVFCFYADCSTAPLDGTGDWANIKDSKWLAVNSNYFDLVFPQSVENTKPLNQMTTDELIGFRQAAQAKGEQIFVKVREASQIIEDRINPPPAVPPTACPPKPCCPQPDPSKPCQRGWCPFKLPPQDGHIWYSHTINYQ